MLPLNYGMIMNGELGMTWKEAAMIYFKPVAQNLLEGSEANHETLQLG
jgi:hypothetical protein